MAELHRTRETYHCPNKGYIKYYIVLRKTLTHRLKLRDNTFEININHYTCHSQQSTTHYERITLVNMQTYRIVSTLQDHVIYTHTNTT